jgi:hypothetical protein
MGRRQIESEVSKAEIGGALSRRGGKKRKLWMLSGEARDSPFPFPRFIDPREPRSRNSMRHAH